MKSLIAAMAAVLLFYSCGRNASNNELAELKSTINTSYENGAPDYKKDFEKEQKGNEADTVITQIIADNKQQRQFQAPEINKDWDKKIIKTANLEIEIKDFKKYNHDLKEKIKNHGGYIAQEEQSQDDYRIQNLISIKVPVDQFESAVSAITENADKLNEKKITSLDVTTEFVDTRSRMESKKQVRQRYIDLLKQAKNMEEILSVQSEINEIQEEIESASGRIEYLGHSSAFSTINLNFYQVLNPQAKSNDNPSYGTKIAQAFKTGWDWVADIFVGLISIWPLFLIILVLLIFLRRVKWTKLKQVS
ncbi:MAG TPA: DUF4349 domain-containing protein [Chitinophagaceae bacterium]|nr:DUF4349 domain-containing protein [Chitinophagaceae bacterium]